MNHAALATAILFVGAGLAGCADDPPADELLLLNPLDEIRDSSFNRFSRVACEADADASFDRGRSSYRVEVGEQVRVAYALLTAPTQAGYEDPMVTHYGLLLNPNVTVIEGNAVMPGPLPPGGDEQQLTIRFEATGRHDIPVAWNMDDPDETRPCRYFTFLVS